MYECPICGVTSNRKGDPFESPAAVVGHIDAKRDDQHAGEAGEDYRGNIERVRSAGAEERESGVAVPESGAYGRGGQSPSGSNDGSGTPSTATSGGHNDGLTEESETSGTPDKLELPTAPADETEESTESGERAELPEQSTESHTETADAVCPDCESERYDTVGNAANKLREAGCDPSAAPDDSRVCVDCWLDGELTVYLPDVEADEGCPECGSPLHDTVGSAAEQIRGRGYDPDAAPDGARVCARCWIEREDVVVYSVGG